MERQSPERSQGITEHESRLWKDHLTGSTFAEHGLLDRFTQRCFAQVKREGKQKPETWWELGHGQDLL